MAALLQRRGHQFSRGDSALSCAQHQSPRLARLERKTMDAKHEAAMQAATDAIPKIRKVLNHPLLPWADSPKLSYAVINERGKPGTDCRRRRRCR